MAAPLLVLQVRIDNALTSDFDVLLTPEAAPTATPTDVYPTLRKHVAVCARRADNAAAQTIIVLEPLPPTQALGANGKDGASAVTTGSCTVHVFVIMDSMQVPAFGLATKAGASSNVLNAYLDAVCEAATASDDLIAELCAAHHKEDLLQLKVHLVVAPNVACSTAGSNVTNATVSVRDAALLQAGATLWGEGALHRKSTCTNGRSYGAGLGLCTTASSAGRAALMVAAGINKVIKEATKYGSGSGGGGATEFLESIRPDTQRKCEPSDFHKLYTSMLTEVSSFSERKTMATVSAFPTMNGLLHYVDATETSIGAPGPAAAAARAEESGAPAGARITATLSPSLLSSSSSSLLPQQEQQPALTVATGGTSPLGAVHSTNFGESRSWNVVNQAIIDALTTDYRLMETL